MGDPAEVLPNELWWQKILGENLTVKEIRDLRRVNKLWKDKNMQIPLAACKRDLQARDVDVQTYDFLCEREGYKFCHPNPEEVQELCNDFKTPLRCMICNKNIIGVSRQGKRHYSETAGAYQEWYYKTGNWEVKDIWVCGREECRRAGREIQDESGDRREASDWSL